MSITQSFSLAIKNLMLSKLRSLLTMLGIIIGVAAVIGIMSISEGMNGYVNDQFASMGSNLIVASITMPSTSRYVEPDDMFALTEKNPEYLSAVSPYAAVSATVKYGTDTYSSPVSGVSESYGSVRSYKVTQGRFLQYIDCEKQKNVCVVGSYVAREVMNNQALGGTIKIGGNTFTVIGVLEEKADSAQGSDDDLILIPYTVAARINGSSSVMVYYFSAAEGADTNYAQWLIENKLNSVFEDSDAYTVITMASMMSIMDDMQGMLVTMFVAIAAISLLVGGIGIMNIMLVTVTERTREIGIRKSQGAKRNDIRLQFIIEAGVTSAIGGAIGIVVGGALGIAVGNALGLTAVPTVTSILVSVGVSVGIGVLFGFLPANKAAKLNPIDALRYE